MVPEVTNLIKLLYTPFIWVEELQVWNVLFSWETISKDIPPLFEGNWNVVIVAVV